MIDKINSINPIIQINTNSNVNNTRAVKHEDSISISQEAQRLSDIYAIKAKVDAVPDIRQDRIAEVMEKMKDPNYINDKVLNATADKIMNIFGL